jgi:hypothetical protein
VINVLAVDPGGTTGYVWWKDGELIDSGQLPPQLFWRLAHDILTEDDIQVVCERFVITARTAQLSQQTDAIENIGVLKYLAWSEALEPVRFQSPSDAKRLATDDVLRTAGLYVPGDHARDAARHLLLHLATSHPRAFQRLTRPHSNDTVLDIDADRDAD